MKIISLVHGLWRLDQLREVEMEISIKTVVNILHHLKKICITKDKEPQASKTHTSALQVDC